MVLDVQGENARPMAAIFVTSLIAVASQHIDEMTFVTEPRDALWFLPPHTLA
ncbi:hypothetical protein [Halovulum sp. GXIMD14793]